MEPGVLEAKQLFVLFPRPLSLRKIKICFSGTKDVRGRRRTAGCVIARQCLGIAKGFIFISMEGGTGFANIIVTPRSKFLLVEGPLQNQDKVMLLATISTTSYDLSMIGMHGETHIKEVGRIQRLVRRDQSEGLLRFDIVRYSLRSDNSIRGK